MEERVGLLWHRWITGHSVPRHTEAAVNLADVDQSLGVLYRACGGDPGVRITHTSAMQHRGHRGWLQRIAGAGQRVHCACVDAEYLFLPPEMACFKTQALNLGVYRWLVALAAVTGELAHHNWLQGNCMGSQKILQQWPGLRRLYRRLVCAHIEQRGHLAHVPKRLMAAESALRKSLLTPVLTADWNEAQVLQLMSVPVWIYPHPGHDAGQIRRPEPPEKQAQSKTTQRVSGRHRSQRVAAEEQTHGLLSFRLESLFSWSEYVPMDRCSEDDEELNAQAVAEDLECISTSAGSSRNQVYMDLDQTPAPADEVAIKAEIRLPEWDARKAVLVPDYCALRCVPVHCTARQSTRLNEDLRRVVRQVRGQFQRIRHATLWHNRQTDGDAVDWAAYLEHRVDRIRGGYRTHDRLYRQKRPRRRDMSCLLLADLSLSTEAHLDNTTRVIDVIQDSLHVFAEALHSVGDSFALMGFCSLRRSDVRCALIKGFDEPLSDVVRDRIDALQPGHYTRMGAAIRYATMQLKTRANRHRVLLLLTDGKPNDLDIYESRYGLEDTRHAVLEARADGLVVFCISIDQGLSEYLPQVFGHRGFVQLRNAGTLPLKLPVLYRRLSA